MLALNYTVPEVLAMFWATQHQQQPSADDLTTFDAKLFRANDASLVHLLNEAGLPTDKDTRSRVLLYSRTGDGDLEDRIRDACVFFRNTQSL